MKAKLCLVLMLFVFIVPLRAQEVKLGFRVELTGLKLSNSNGNNQFTWATLPNVLELTLGVITSKDFEIEGRFGIAPGLSIEDYSGLEYGLLLKLFLAKGFYFTGGAAGHSNSGGSHILGGTSESSWIGPAIGLGVKPSDVVGFELLYQGANDSPIAYNVSPSYNGPVVKKNVSWLLKLGFSCSWSL